MHFEKVSRFADDDGVIMPSRGTFDSAGYDLYVAEDTIVYPLVDLSLQLINRSYDKSDILTLDEMADITKKRHARPALVSTGMKVKLEPETYLEIVARSSTPLKYWLMVANGVGVIDADYYNNPDNEGEIFVQLINLSPFPIKLQKGEKVAQGIFKEYKRTKDDAVDTLRTGGFGSTT